ncbi:eukaryotic translation initiation factor 3 subunit 6 [Cordyceps fumosorosea ARSEF 2679]|uniref:Eukaryotic translation initiation factor 3 subunit E n=1 Tax=Cordyceps fumosorosea (strain ARSEF 2679) TaxID=1081104 RepID=A0A168EA26_CORFA|nr:eukaryotic translation initiation factor 3 subunit 6 [Cordyceps fumosorosea ARSEF 2679]OAA73561.1 eukaryotic translation initiation factor 3 subunit 6 [Cordyceps fumosorosea ARSEF 2679]
MEDVLNAVAADGTSIMPKLAPHLSRHLLFPLIQFEGDKADEKGDTEAFNRILAGKIALLEDTNMTDYVANMYCELHGVEEPPAEYVRKREAVVAQLQKYEQATATIADLLTQDDVVNGLRSDKVANLEFLKNQHGVTLEMVDALYDFGQFQFRCGQYGPAADMLYQFRVLSTDNDKVSASTWGKLACEILSANWDSAVDELKNVREGIDTKLFSNPRAQLDHRAMLLHWALFPLFNHDAAREPVLDMFFSAPYINTVQTACPWILRYLIAAVITSRGRGGSSRANTPSTSTQQKQLKDVVRYVRQEAYEYADPVTQFIAALYIAHDFDAARDALRRAEEVCRADFFLASSADAFVDAARHLICESYCKIFSRMNIRDLSAKLGLDPDDGEKWIVNLIRETRLDAKIDSKDGTVIMNHPPNNVYQQVIEKTKGGFFRTQVLNAAVSK